MSRRTSRVGSTLQRAAQEVLSRGLQDPRLQGLITVTRVVVSEDLKAATVYVSVLPKERQDLVLHGLKSAAAHIRRRIGDLVALKQMPRLLFKLDHAVQAQAEVYEALSHVREERDSKSASPNAGQEEDERP